MSPIRPTDVKNLLIALQLAAQEERNGGIEYRVVNNDGSQDSTIVLTGLKCLFQKQLSKMAKEYIARLVFDHSIYLSPFSKCRYRSLMA